MIPLADLHLGEARAGDDLVVDRDGDAPASEIESLQQGNDREGASDLLRLAVELELHSVPTVRQRPGPGKLPCRGSMR